VCDINRRTLFLRQRQGRTGEGKHQSRYHSAQSCDCHYVKFPSD
jgi:hypothetical protein